MQTSQSMSMVLAEPKPFIEGLESSSTVDDRREEYEERLAKLRAWWHHQRWEGAVQRDAQLEAVHRSFAGERHKLETELREKLGRRRDGMIRRRQEALQKLRADVSPEPASQTSTAMTGAETAAVPSGRSLRSANRSKAAADPSAALPASNLANASAVGSANPVAAGMMTTNRASRQRTGTPSSTSSLLQDSLLLRLGISPALSEPDVASDLQTILADMPPNTLSSHANGKRGRHNSNTNNYGSNNSGSYSNVKGPQLVIEPDPIDAAITDYGTLRYEGREFGKGAVLTLEFNGHRFSGTLSSIGNTEVWIRRSDGSGAKNKIYLGQLRVGKYKILSSP
jgi:hypothetical protein